MTTDIAIRRRSVAKHGLLPRAGRMIALVALTATLLAVVWHQHSHLQRPTFTTGYALYAAVFGLVSLHWRKQAPSLPLGRVSIWLRYHIYLGYFAILLFAVHVSFRFPTGIFEGVLFAVFGVVASSGVYGIYLTRTVPRQLRRLPEEVIYERIPEKRRSLAQEAQQLVLAGATDSTVLTDYYQSTLAAFFEQPRGTWYTLRPNSRKRRYLLAQLHELHRFLNPHQRGECDKLAELVCHKDDLDFHAALQCRLKLWMYVHIAFSYSLLLLGAVHGIVAHAFRGGAQ